MEVHTGATWRIRCGVVELAAAERVSEQVRTVGKHGAETELGHADRVQRQQSVQLHNRQ